MTRCARRSACRARRWSAWGCTASWRPSRGASRRQPRRARVAYVMTDSAALPLAYSRLVQTLREQGLLAVTITAGQAFGGELEAVNPYSALVTAAVAGKADIIIAGQGPGNVGTATALGFGGVEQAMLLNAAVALDGRAHRRAAHQLRRPARAPHRHQPPHAHRARAVDAAARLLPLPALAPEHTDHLLAQIEQHGLPATSCAPRRPARHHLLPTARHPAHTAWAATMKTTPSSSRPPPPRDEWRRKCCKRKLRETQRRFHR